MTTLVYGLCAFIVFQQIGIYVMMLLFDHRLKHFGEMLASRSFGEYVNGKIRVHKAHQPPEEDKSYEKALE